MQTSPVFIAIDLKSFYASVECVERGLDPLRTNLVVADSSRTEKTICLAVSPSLKSYGVPGRPRLFEVVEKVRQINAERLSLSPQGVFSGRSFHDLDLQRTPSLELDYIVAPPRMSLYLKYSSRIYGIYLKYVSAEDIHVYSVDEVFIDASAYIRTYRCTPHELAMRMILSVLKETGITATAGIGPNLYLCKVAMDIVAKHIPADKDGVRIAELDEMSYREKLWSHRPLTDFWRVGRGIARKLEANGMHTFGDVARMSLTNEPLLFKLFGVNAELLIDHAWGYEPVGMKEIKAYRPMSRSISSGQVLQEPYSSEAALIVAKEMAADLSLRLVETDCCTSQLVLSVGYDIESLNVPSNGNFEGELRQDFYGRLVPRYAHGSSNMPHPTASPRLLMSAVEQIYRREVNPSLLVRRLNIGVNCLRYSSEKPSPIPVQLDLFGQYEEHQHCLAECQKEEEKERRLLRAILSIQKRYGKNALMRGIDFEQGATLRARNKQIGGHKA